MFFIPLGFSASLTSLSHVIINGTLARGEQAELIIASYAIAFSIFLMMERPVFLIRQTTSALVQDQVSYRAMLGVTSYVIGTLLALSAVVAFTPVGDWFFLTLFDAEGRLLEAVLEAYRVLIVVSVFSAYRCVYQGIIINKLQTKWLTIGMIVRLAVMGGIALFFILTGQVDSAVIGGIIFLSGMFVEFAISLWKGKELLQEFPRKLEEHDVSSKAHVFRFYSPLLFSGSIAVLIMPAANALMGYTDRVTLAIASFALAMSIQQLALSFFMYFHQIVLQFYKRHARNVVQWSAVLAVFPTLILGVFCFTPIGYWFIERVMGTSAELSEATMMVMRVFMLKPLLFPIVDFCNGILMLRKQTHVMVLSQAANVSVTVALLLVLAFSAPQLDGMIAAIAVSAGVLAELLVVGFYVWRYRHQHKVQFP